jgi:arylsulfatase A-like enzyme/Tfp pilus assembly protein PilF
MSAVRAPVAAAARGALATVKALTRLLTAATPAALAAFGALTLAACRAGPGVTAPPGLTGRPVILITIDTLRADRVGAYGSTRGLTPSLDRFAKGAVRFTAAVTEVPLTLPAHATILTGLHPAHHGVRTNDGFQLASGAPTLADALRGRGYATGAFIGGYPLRAASGLPRGFDRYDDAFLHSTGVVERSADEVVRSSLVWIDENKSRPFFAWLHLFDPHSPYTPPAPFAAAYADAPYDGEIAYTDAAIGRLFDRLRQLDLFSRAAILVVADHGESLGEHGERTHGTFLYDATVHVPLLVKLPGPTAAGVVTVPVETSDLAPTIAAVAGATLGPVDGQNLLPLLPPAGAAAGDPDRPAYAETYYQHVLLGWSPLRAVRTRRWKFIEAPRSELYDLERDPGERQNRIEDRAALASELQRSLPALPAVSSSSRSLPSAAGESAERLRTLGYVSGFTTPPAAGTTGGTAAIDPKDRVEVWANIEAGLDHIAGDPGAAQQAFSRALRLDPGNGLAMKYLADLSFRAGRHREARGGYRRAIAAGFRHPDVFVNLASIAEQEGRLDEARAALSEALQLAASDAESWNRLGLLEARRGAAEAARSAFTQAIAAASDRAEPYYNLAVVERRIGNEAAAEAHLQDALARNPVYAEAHYELGTGYLAANQPQRAIVAYRAALASRPDYAEALFGAARAELDLGLRDEARRDYEHFVRVAPRAYVRQIAAAREVLQRLAVR